MSIRFEKNKCIVKFMADVSMESINRLVEDIEDAISYYQYDQIELQIESMGGRIDAFKYFLSCLKKWRQEKNIQFSTTVLSSAASAGALMFSMGDKGCRKLMPDSKVLFHNSRTKVESVVTANNADNLNQSLRLADKEMFNNFFTYNQPKLEQIYAENGGIVSLSKKTEKLIGKIKESDTEKEFIKKMRKKYKKLFSHEHFLPASDAIALGLADKIA